VIELCVCVCVRARACVTEQRFWFVQQCKEYVRPVTVLCLVNVCISLARYRDEVRRHLTERIRRYSNVVGTEWKSQHRYRHCMCRPAVQQAGFLLPG
jgi:hypothetical protein